MTGSMRHSRYWRMAIGKVVRPGPTRNSDISRFPKEMMKPKSAAATTPGRMSGSVTRRNVAHGVAPRESAASSTERSSPARLAVTSRTVHGIVMRTWARTRPGRDATSGSVVRISASTWKTYMAVPATIPGTTSGSRRSVLTVSRPRNR
jgi:hypothetical protein